MREAHFSKVRNICLTTEIKLNIQQQENIGFHVVSEHIYFLSELSYIINVTQWQQI